MKQVTVTADVSAKKELHSKFLLKYRNTIVEIISSLLIFLFVYTALGKLLRYTFSKYVPGQSMLKGSKAAVEALALPITWSLISAFLFFPERIRICGFKGSFETVAILPYAWHIRPSLRQALPCSCDGWLKQIKPNRH